METINTRIAALIRESGKTKTEWAGRLNVTPQFMSSLCNGKKSPSDRTIADICREFHVSEAWLRTGEGEMFVPEPVFDLGAYARQHKMTELETQILRAYLELDPELRESLLQHFKERLTAQDAPPEQTPAPAGITARMAELECQNKELAAKVAAMKKEDARMETAEDLPGKIIQLRFKVPGYAMPMSAGTGQEAGQEYPDDYTLVKEQPRGTSFIAPVSGDSMEPTYHDGDRLFIRATVDIQPGQVGVFLMDGKQWVKELGDGVLISHNPDYPPRPMTDDVRCQGLVLGVCDESYFA